MYSLLFVLFVCTCNALQKSVPPDPSAVNLQHGITSSITTHKPGFTISPGNYYFNDSPFVIANATDFTVSASSDGIVTLWFRLGYGIRVDSCVNTTVRGIIIDYSPPPFVFGKITAVTGISRNAPEATVEVTLDPISMLPEDFVAMYPPQDTWPPIVVFNARGLQCKPCGWGQAPLGTHLHDRVYRYSVCPNTVAVGDIVVAPTRYGFTYIVVNGTSVTTENLSIHAAGYFSVVDLNGNGGNTYDHVRIVSPYADRPLPSNADGFHAAGSKKGPVISNCEIQNMNDDFFNVHNTLLLVASRVDDTTLLVVEPHLFSGPSDSIYGTFSVLPHVRPGDVFSFFPLNYLSISSRIAQLHVTSVVREESPSLQYLIQQTYAAGNTAAKGCPLDACGDGLRPWTSATLYRVKFAETVPTTVVQTVLMSTDTWNSAGAVIRNNVFNSTSCNLGRIKSVGGQIVNNYFGYSCIENLEAGPLQNFIEGPAGVTGVVISGNTIERSGANPIRVYASEVQAVGNKIIP